jgi:hypothetical protein
MPSARRSRPGSCPPPRGGGSTPHRESRRRGSAPHRSCAPPPDRPRSARRGRIWPPVEAQRDLQRGAGKTRGVLRPATGRKRLPSRGVTAAGSTCQRSAGIGILPHVDGERDGGEKAEGDDDEKENTHGPEVALFCAGFKAPGGFRICPGRPRPGNARKSSSASRMRAWSQSHQASAISGLRWRAAGGRGWVSPGNRRRSCRARRPS